MPDVTSKYQKEPGEVVLASDQDFWRFCRYSQLRGVLRVELTDDMFTLTFPWKQLGIPRDRRTDGVSRFLRHPPVCIPCKLHSGGTSTDRQLLFPLLLDFSVRTHSQWMQNSRETAPVDSRPRNQLKQEIMLRNSQRECFGKDGNTP